jgi:hypothetical protein
MIDGSPRPHPGPVAKPLPKSLRSKRANGRLVANGNTARGRRMRELLADYGRDLPLGDESVRSLVKSAVTITLETEALEDKADLGQPVDGIVLARLTNTKERLAEKIRTLRAQLRPAPIIEGQGGWTSALARHLHKRAWQKTQYGDSLKAIPPAALALLDAEYAERERQREFLDAAR